MVAILTDQFTGEVGDVVVLPRQRRQVIHAVDGILWITQAGDAADILLRAGESKSFEGSGRIAVQPFQGRATFIVEKAPGRVSSVLRNLAGRLRLIPRLTQSLRRLAPAGLPKPTGMAPCTRLEC